MTRIESARIMITSKLLVLLTLVVAVEQASALTLPDDNFVGGWMKPVKPLTYDRESLSDYVDGDAELFNEMGFQQLEVQQYKKGSDEIDLEFYELDSPNGALGIYLLKCGKESPSPKIEARNTVNETQLLAVKGNFFIQILNYTNSDRSLPVMIELAQQALSSVAATASPTILDRLPKDGLERGSERVFCGPLSLQPTLRLGKGDLLQLQKKVYGAAGKYAAADRTTFFQAVIPYPDNTSAGTAFAWAVMNLDPALQAFEKTKEHFAFKDRSARYGFVELKGSVIEIKWGLSAKPGANK